MTPKNWHANRLRRRLPLQFRDSLVRCGIRLLRLGMWLPFFVLWGLPIWRINPGKDPYLVVWLTTVTAGVFAAGPTVLLASCYGCLTDGIQLKRQKPLFDSTS